MVSVQVGSGEVWDTKKHLTGINKVATSSIEIFEPGAREDGGRSGVRGDFVGDLVHHGGSEQAVYLVASEELAYWSNELGKTLKPGNFGENVTTSGIDVDGILIGTQLAIGSAILQITGPRIPCRTFAWALDVAGWVKTFTQHARPGAYARVIRPGVIRPDDVIEVVATPSHDISIIDVFGAFTTDREARERVVAAHVLAPRYHAELEEKLRKAEPRV